MQLHYGPLNGLMINREETSKHHPKIVLEFACCTGSSSSWQDLGGYAISNEHLRMAARIGGDPKDASDFFKIGIQWDS